MKLGILLSGRGSNFLAIHRQVEAGILTAEIACVVSDNPDSAGLEKARELGLAAFFVDPRNRKKKEYETEIVAILRDHGVGLVCLAGYMRILSPLFIQSFKGRILNIHPSLLPAFPGLHAQRQALEHGVKVAGCTVHFVDEGTDTGPVILQAAVPVRDDDTEETLSARILEQEHRIYSQAIAKVIDNKIVLIGRRVLDRP